MVVNTLADLKTLVEQYGGLYIYGAGHYGQALKACLDEMKIKISSYVISERPVVNMQDNIPVKWIDDIQTVNKKLILIAVASPEAVKEIEAILSKYACNYVLGTKLFWAEVRKKRLSIIAEKAEMQHSENENLFRIGYLYPGYLDANYEEKRMIADKLMCHPVLSQKVEYIKIPKEIDIIETVGGYGDSFYKSDRYQPKVDVLHTINMVCKSPVNWCTSFETMIPRIVDVDQKVSLHYARKLLPYLEKDNCFALISWCKNAYDIAVDYLYQIGDTTQIEHIIPKMHVLHPPQEILISKEDLNQKLENDNEELTFLLIASQFFMKGGKEILLALKKFLGAYPFKLKIIGSVGVDDYFVHQTLQETEKFKRMIDEEEWIEFLGWLPNDQVLEECKKADIGLLPSYGDTYGYSVLEMQAAGCPVITSNIRALPEINNEDCGYICNLPVDRFRRCVPDNMKELSAIMEEELTKKFDEIFQNPQKARRKGYVAVERIKQMHDPMKYAENLWKIYHGNLL